MHQFEVFNVKDSSSSGQSSRVLVSFKPLCRALELSAVCYVIR